MTPSTADRPEMSIEDFDELARKAPRNVKLEFIGGRLVVKHGRIDVEDFEELARRAPETVTLELINGKLRVKPVPDGDHGEIYMWLMRQCMQHRPDLGLYPEQGLLIDTYRKGRARPDGALAPIGHFAGQEEWAHPNGVLMLVEITSHDSDTHRRDRIEKRGAYATDGIPVYLLIDRDNHTLTVFSRPKHGRYEEHPSYAYGDTVPLPDPVGITLDTERLKDFAH
ncbi:Uma2 family endonuclease [Streptomyces sp. ISL-99]|uniref:Uma2 family endonuclease n=1 Tax=Streptomyces sp. ISL-99 TaxID=2819193 RepID=UPI00203615FD|nr:Uma2 family endonuclease [Streptomyces sp. ISL-99]